MLFHNISTKNRVMHLNRRMIVIMIVGKIEDLIRYHIRWFGWSLKLFALEVISDVVRKDHINVNFFEFVDKNRKIVLVYPVVTIKHAKIFTGSMANTVIDGRAGTTIWLAN